MKKIVIIPTLNENKNIDILVSKILKIDQSLNLLFIDDNSTDGTKQKIIKFSKKNNNINYVFRKKKLGVRSSPKGGL